MKSLLNGSAFQQTFRLVVLSIAGRRPAIITRFRSALTMAKLGLSSTICCWTLDAVRDTRASVALAHGTWASCMRAAKPISPSSESRW